MRNPRDKYEFERLKEMNLPTNKRQPQWLIDAIEQIPLHQRGKRKYLLSGNSINTTDLPDCVADMLPEASQHALSQYKALMSEGESSITGSFEPMTGGGDKSPNPSDHQDDARAKWYDATMQLHKSERKFIKWALGLEDHALINIDRATIIRSGAAKLAEYFDNGFG